MSRQSIAPRVRGLAPTLLVCALAASAPATAQDTAQRADIHALVQELDYLIDTAEALARRYRHDEAPIRFNYPALIEQLRTTRARSAAYLNEALEVLHAAPPGTVRHSLTRRR